MLIFVKSDCPLCGYLKSNADLSDIEVQQLDGPIETAREALALLAFYEAYSLAEKAIPVLVTPEDFNEPPTNDFAKICKALKVPMPGEKCEDEVCAL